MCNWCLGSREAEHGHVLQDLTGHGTSGALGLRAYPYYWLLWLQSLNTHDTDTNSSSLCGRHGAEVQCHPWVLSLHTHRKPERCRNVIYSRSVTSFETSFYLSFCLSRDERTPDVRFPLVCWLSVCVVVLSSILSRSCTLTLSLAQTPSPHKIFRQWNTSNLLFLVWCKCRVPSRGGVHPVSTHKYSFRLRPLRRRVPSDSDPSDVKSLVTASFPSSVVRLPRWPLDHVHWLYHSCPFCYDRLFLGRGVGGRSSLKVPVVWFLIKGIRSRVR